MFSPLNHQAKFVAGGILIFLLFLREMKSWQTDHSYEMQDLFSLKKKVFYLLQMWFAL